MPSFLQVVDQFATESGAKDALFSLAEQGVQRGTVKIREEIGFSLPSGERSPDELTETARATIEGSRTGREFVQGGPTLQTDPRSRLADPDRAAAARGGLPFGLTIGGVLTLLAGGGLVWWLVKRRKRRGSSRR